MKRYYAFIFFLFFTFSTLGLLQAKPQTIRFATIVPEDTSWYREMLALSDEVKAKTKGQVLIKIYANAKMGDELDALRKMRSGQVHAGAFSGMGLGEIDPAIRIMEMPFLFQNDKEVDYVYEKMFPVFANRFKKKGMILVSTGEAGGVYIYSKEPIADQAALSKSKVWVWDGDPLASAFFRVAKVSPVSLPITDVLTALNTGMVNTVYTPPIGAIGFQWWTKVRYMTHPHLNNATGGMVISKKKWDQISLAHQKIILDVSRRAGNRITNVTRKDNIEAIAILKKNNIQVIEVSSQSMQDFHDISNQVRKELTGKLYDDSVLKSVEKHLSEYRAKKNS